MPATLNSKFTALLRDDPLCVVDVGARGGFQKQWQTVREYCTFVGFEPEEGEAARLQRLAAPNEHYIASALYSAPTRATLYQCQSPARSSLYPPDMQMISEVYGASGAYEVEREVEIDVTTLDLLLEQGALPRPDFIKLDTQGCDLDILKGAITALDGLLAIQTEVLFLPLYRGQPLFSDVDTFLRDKGFELVGFKDLHRKMDVRFFERGMRGYSSTLEFLRAWTGRLIGPQGMLNAVSQLVYGDALYIRPPGSFLSQVSQRDGTSRVAKAVLLSSVLKLYEYSFETLDSSRKRDLIGAEDADELERFIHACTRDRMRPLWMAMHEQSTRLVRRLRDPGRRRS